MASEYEAEGLVFGDDIIASMEAEEIFRLITQLPLGYRTVFNLFVVEGFGHKEIAQLLKITEGTSKSQLSKARQMLQQLIESQNKIINVGG